MRSLLFLSLLFSVLFSCKEAPKQEAVVVKGKALVTLPVKPDSIRGLYTGEFKGSPISIMLDYVSHRHVSGYNVHKGLKRNFSGTIAFSGSKLQLQLSEPGNNPFDGQFTLQLDTATWKGRGTWNPLKKGDPVQFRFARRIINDYEDVYGQTFTDSLANYIQLNSDGSCLYAYLTDTTSTAQQLTVRGNFKKEKDAVIIYWQKNVVFPSGKSVFKLVNEKPYPDEDYTELSLKGEGRVFSEMQL